VITPSPPRLLSVSTASPVLIVIATIFTTLAFDVYIIAIADSDHPNAATLAVGVYIIAIADNDHHHHQHARCRRLHHRQC
jgi:hypothetical protein